MKSVLRRTFFVLALVILAAFTWTGLSGGMREYPGAETPGQRAQAASQFLYGAFALLSLVTTFRAQRFQRAMLIGFGGAMTLAAGLAPVVWGGTALWTGLLSGSVTLLLAVGVAAVLRRERLRSTSPGRVDPQPHDM